MAKLFFRYGAMNSGKSTILIQTAYNYEERGMHVFIVKPMVDVKGNDKIVSRIGIEKKVDILLSASEDIFEIVLKKHRDIHCILVDEAQFLTKEQVDQLMQIVIELDIPVICYGLRTDFRTVGFPGATRLLEIAHTIEELKTICSCGRKAMYNARFLNDQFTIEGDQVAIDGVNKISYVSMCGKCYFEKRKELMDSNKKEIVL